MLLFRRLAGCDGPGRWNNGPWWCDGSILFEDIGT